MRKTQLREILFLVGFWTLAAAFLVAYGAMVRGFQRPEQGASYSFPNELALALLVTVTASAAMASFEVLYLRRFLRRRPFGATLILQTAFYLSCIVFFSSLAVALIHSVGQGRPFYDSAVLEQLGEYWTQGLALLEIVYWGGVILLSLFVLQVSQKFGQGVLVNYLMGRYHQPKEEQRIFMFLDLKSSTKHAEHLGHIRYSRLIQDCFYDLTDVVALHHAMIYQYVGDEVVLTWDLDEGLSDADCLRIFQDYDERLGDRAEHYRSAYGFVPEFKAGVNVGLVTVAEVGEIKKELAYHGDVLNTASRIQGKCNELGRRVLVSEALMKLFASSPDYAFDLVGEVELKGKAKPVRVYGLEGDSGPDPEPEASAQPTAGASPAAAPG